MSYSNKSTHRTPSSELRDKHYERHRPNNSSVSSSKLRPCRDGLDCILYDSTAHCSKYSHPCRFAHRCNKKDTEPHLTHEPNPSEKCKYDEKCVKIDDPRHRASFSHPGKPDYLRACRDQIRCSDNSFEHRSKYSHGEYKLIFNSPSSAARSQYNRDDKHTQKNGSREENTATSFKKMDRGGLPSSEYSPASRTPSKSRENSNTQRKPGNRRRSQSQGRSKSREDSNTQRKPGNRERSQSQGKSKSRGRSQSQGKSKSRGRSQSQGRSKSREDSNTERKPGNRERSQSQGKSKSRGRSQSQGKSKGRGRSKSQGRSRSHSRSKSREKQDNYAFRDSTNHKINLPVSAQTSLSKSSHQTDRSDRKSTTPTRDYLNANQYELPLSAERSSRDRNRPSQSDDRKSSLSNYQNESSAPNPPKSILRSARRSRSRKSSSDSS